MKHEKIEKNYNNKRLFFKIQICAVYSDPPPPVAKKHILGYEFSIKKETFFMGPFGDMPAKNRRLFYAFPRGIKISINKDTEKRFFNTPFQTSKEC